MNKPKIQTIFEEREDHAEVMQDKYAQPRISAASSQPVRATTPAPMPKHHGSNTRQTVEVAGYVKPSIRAELERMAKQQKLSLSKVVASLLEKAIQGEIDMQYGAMLRPVIEACVKREINARIDRTNQLSMNAFLAGEQGRVLTIHVLSLLLGGGGDALPQLVKDSQKQAWANLKYLMRHTEGEEN
jgi:hypothetical protein